MRSITRTVYAANLQTAQFFNISHVIPENSTLNEKFGIEPDTRPSNNVYPELKYLAIGNQGHQLVEGAQGIAYTAPRRHAATDAACFRHIPFVLRELSNDLPAGERQRYALRRIENIDGVDYVAYYLRRIDVSGVNVEMRRTFIENGDQVSEVFQPTGDNLTPTPVEPLEQADVVSSSGQYVSASAVFPVIFDQADAEEIKNVANVLYGSSSYAVVSEIALCTGRDHTSTGTGPSGNDINYNEAIGVQVAAFISDYNQLDLDNEGFQLNIDNGITEPLFVTST